MTRYLKTKSPDFSKLIILYDDREKQRWILPWSMKRIHLSVGDYSIEGFETKIAVEKKSGLQELLNNLTGAQRERFERFLGRLAEYPIKCIVIEDELSNLPHTIAIMQRKTPTQLTCNTVYYWLSVIITKYRIPVLFVGRYNNVKESMIRRLFEQCYKTAINLKGE